MLAHASGWGYEELMAMPIDDLQLWCDEAQTLLRQLYSGD